MYCQQENILDVAEGGMGILGCPTFRQPATTPTFTVQQIQLGPPNVFLPITR